MKTELSTRLTAGPAAGRATPIARGVARVPDANLITFIGRRSGEPITCSAQDHEMIAAEVVEYVLHKMKHGEWCAATR